MTAPAEDAARDPFEQGIEDYGTPLLRDSARRRSSGCTCFILAAAALILGGLVWWLTR